VVVQHRDKDADGLCEFLQKRSVLPLSEPDDKEAIAPGRVYLAPRGYHLLIEKENFALSTESPVGYARPQLMCCLNRRRTFIRSAPSASS
jgi:two-component system chemotaxis response regulator CheB